MICWCWPCTRTGGRCSTCSTDWLPAAGTRETLFPAHPRSRSEARQVVAVFIGRANDLAAPPFTPRGALQGSGINVQLGKRRTLAALELDLEMELAHITAVAPG